MKNTLLLFISIILSLKSFSQVSENVNELSFYYSSSSSTPKILYLHKRESIMLKRDSTGNYRFLQYYQSIKDSKIKLKQGKTGMVSLMTYPNPSISSLPIISNGVVVNLIKSLSMDNNNNTDSLFKNHVKNLSSEEIISIFKKKYQPKEDKSGIKKLRELEQHFTKIRDLNTLTKFINNSIEYNKKITSNYSESRTFSIQFSKGKDTKSYEININIENYLSPFFSAYFDERKIKNYNLDTHWILFNFLPTDSFVRDLFDVNRLYINWYLENKM